MSGKSPIPKQLRITALYYLAFIGLGLSTASFGPTLPGLAANTGSDLRQISSLFLVRSLGYLIGSAQAGRLYDRIPGHPVLSIASLVMAILMISIPFVGNILVLSLVLLLLGFFEGMLDVGNNTLLVWLHRDQVAPFMNGLHFFFGVGTFIAPSVIAIVLTRTEGISWAYWILGLLMLPTPILMFQQPSPKPEHHPDSGSLPLRPAKPMIIALSATLFFLYVGAEVGYGGWIYTYALTLKLGDVTSAAYLTSAFWGAFTAGRLLGIPVAARLKPDAVLLVDILGCLFSLITILLFPGSSLILWAGTIGTGFFMASIFPTVLNLAERQMTMSSRVTSWFFIGASLGGMTLPWLIGQFFERSGPRFAMLAIFGSMCMAGCIFVFLMRNSSRTPPPLFKVHYASNPSRSKESSPS